MTEVSAQAIAEALGGKRSGDGYRCNCPVHGGTSGTSFSVRDGRNGPLVKCFAGCSQSDVIQDLRSRGLWADATPEQKQKYREQKQRKKIEHAELVKEIAEADQQAGKVLNEADQAVVAEADKIIAEQDEEGKRVVRLVPGQISQTCDETELALVEAEAGPIVFNHGGLLVSPSVAKRGTGRGVSRPENSVVLTPVDSNRLAEKAADVATFMKYDGRSDRYKIVDPPKRYMDTILSRAGSWSHIPEIVAVTRSPTLRLSDGTVVDQPGYDSATGLYLSDDVPEDYEPPPLRPTQEAVADAVDTLDDLYSTFPFVDPCDFSAMLGSLMTSIIRGQLPNAPLFAISANAAGTGKSLASDVVAICATGARAPVLSLGRDPIEADKIIKSALLAGDPLLSFDNMVQPVAGDFMAQIISQIRVTIRPLGSSTVARIRTNVTLLANGNNLAVHGDLRRRVVLIRLDAGTERPERRHFDRDMFRYTTENRGRIINAVLALLLGFRAAGFPRADVFPFGGFPDWDLWVRHSLIWAGLTDPLSSSDLLRDTDPDLEATQQFYAAMWDRFESQPVTAAQLIQGAPDYLRDALYIVCQENIAARRLTWWLKRHKGVIVDGLRITDAGKDLTKKVARWKIERCG